MNLTDFDTSKFKLGTLCKRGHDYEGTGQSLRDLQRRCVECNRILQQEYYAETQLASSYFNRKRLQIGILCKFGHEFNGTGGSLRRKSDNFCVKCALVAKVEKDRINRQIRIKEGRNEKERKRAKEYSAKYYQENKDERKKYSAEWADENPAATFWHREDRRIRVSRQSDGTVTKDFVYDLFANSDKCCYCLAMFDSTTKATKKTVDHIIPIKLGGLHSARNLAICCFGCNNRKREKSYPEWLDCLEPKQRKSAERLYYKRYGVSPIQGVLPLTFETEDKSDD